MREGGRKGVKNRAVRRPWNLSDRQTKGVSNRVALANTDDNDDDDDQLKSRCEL